MRRDVAALRVSRPGLDLKKRRKKGSRENETGKMLRGGSQQPDKPRTERTFARAPAEGESLKERRKGLAGTLRELWRKYMGLEDIRVHQGRENAMSMNGNFIRKRRDRKKSLMRY